MRSPKFSSEAYAHDCAVLQRIMRRILSDEARPLEKRRELGGHLHAVIDELQKEMLASEGKP